jgi:hypothetical protein
MVTACLALTNAQRIYDGVIDQFHVQSFSLLTNRVSRAARCLVGRSFAAWLPSEPRGHLLMHELSSDMVPPSGLRKARGQRELPACAYLG